MLCCIIIGGVVRTINFQKPYDVNRHLKAISEHTRRHNFNFFLTMVKIRTFKTSNFRAFTKSQFRIFL